MPGPEMELKTCQTEHQETNHTDASTSNGKDSYDNSERPKISTLVFMDLESTGLPSDVGTRNVQITEMCMVAVDRNSFEVDKKLRVLNKISLCVRPRFHISPGSMLITGLYNDMLENQEKFDDSVPKLLEYFFRRLQKPICLLAHNGNRFDFPVLQAELNRLNFTLGSDIVCADTLVAFRAICQVQKQAVAAREAEKKINKEMEAERKVKEEIEANRTPEAHVGLVKLCYSTPISDEDIDNLLSQDLESFSQIKDAEVYDRTFEPGLTKILAPENDILSEKKTVQPKEFLSPSQNEKTPEKNEVSLHSDKPKNIRKRKILDPTFLPKNLYKYNKKKILPAKRILFPEPNNNDSSCLEIHKITRFSLQNLYNHFFHENPPNSHYAEDDCISLSKVCQKINSDFLEWIDQNSVAFSTIDALW